MALVADSPAERAEQLILLTRRLAELIVADTARIVAREPPLAGAEAEEKQRLANAYRLELARIKQDKTLISEAPPSLLSRLRAETDVLNRALDEHAVQLGAVKAVVEGLVQAMAEDLAQQRAGGRNYGAGGALSASPGPAPTLLDRSA